MDYLCNCKSEISNVCNALEGHCLEVMKIVHYHANVREIQKIYACPSCASKIKLYSLYVYICIDQNAYNKVSDTFIDYKKKLKLSFLVLENNDAMILLSWGVEGDGYLMT